VGGADIEVHDGDLSTAHPSLPAAQHTSSVDASMQTNVCTTRALKGISPASP
jgi:hypothetical protein